MIKRTIILYLLVTMSFVAFAQYFIPTDTVVTFSDGSVLNTFNKRCRQLSMTQYDYKEKSSADMDAVYTWIIKTYKSGDYYEGYAVFENKEKLDSFYRGETADFQPICGILNHPDDSEEKILIDWKDNLKKMSKPSPVGKWFYQHRPAQESLEFYSNGKGVESRYHFFSQPVPLEGSSSYNRAMGTNHAVSLTGGYTVDIITKSTQTFSWKYDGENLTITYTGSPNISSTANLNIEESFNRTDQSTLQRTINQARNDINSNPRVRESLKNSREIRKDICPAINTSVTFKVYAILDAGIVMYNHKGKRQVFLTSNRSRYLEAFPILLSNKVLEDLEQKVSNYHTERIREIKQQIRLEQERIKAEQKKKMLQKADSIVSEIRTVDAQISGKYELKLFDRGLYTYQRISEELKINDYVSTYNYLSKNIYAEKELCKFASTIDNDAAPIFEFYSIFTKLILYDDYTDSIRMATKVIKEQASNGSKDVWTSFSRMYKEIPFSKRFFSFAELKEYNRILSELVEEQKRCMEFIKTRQNILTVNDSLKKAYSSHKDISKAYKQYYEQVDLAWNKGITKDKLQPVIETQHQLSEFVIGRDKIASNNTIILQKCKSASYIKNVYANFMKNSDLYWTPTVTVEKLSSVIELQENLINGLDNINLKNINKSCSKNKISNIAEIVTLLLK